MCSKIIVIYDDMHELLIKIGDYVKARGEKICMQHWSELEFISDDLTIQNNGNIYYLDRMGEWANSYYSQILAMNDIMKDKLNNIINKPLPYLTLRDKALTMIALRNIGTPIPWTQIVHKIDTIITICGHRPTITFVAKPLLGCCAEDIIIFRKEPPKRVNELIERDGTIILQEFISSPKRFIWRLDIVDSVIIQANQRFSYNPESEFAICNGSIGGDIVIFNERDIPSDVANLALVTVEKLGLDVAGVDLIQDEKGRIYVLEVNPEPDITLSHEDFPFAIAKLLLNRLQQDRNRKCNY